MIKTISKAYLAENLMGSYCTAPLRTYNAWFQGKIQASTSTYERTAWMISHVVSGIFAYVTLGALALVGIAINLCFISTKNRYSLWARWNKVPETTDKFCTQVTHVLESVCTKQMESGEFISTSSDNDYTYELAKQHSFVIQDDFTNTGSSTESTTQKCLQSIGQHTTSILNTIQDLSRQYSWCPEKLSIRRTTEGKVIVDVFIPDHINEEIAASEVPETLCNFNDLINCT